MASGTGLFLHSLQNIHCFARYVRGRSESREYHCEQPPRVSQQKTQGPRSLVMEYLLILAHSPRAYDTPLPNTSVPHFLGLIWASPQEEKVEKGKSIKKKKLGKRILPKSR